MKRAWSILGVAGLTCVITYLAVTRHFAEQRAGRLDQALMDAEARLAQLEGQLDDFQAQLAELRRTQELSRSTPRPSRMTSVRPTSPTSDTAAPLQTGLPVGFAGGGSAAPGIVDLSGTWLRYAALPSGPGITNLVRIEGTSSVHDWQVEGHLIAGRAEFAPGFPVQPGTQGSPDTIEARVNVRIPVHSLKSVEPDGRPYSGAMDEIMYGKLRDRQYNEITYTLTSLIWKTPPPDGAPIIYEATGKLGVAGVTNSITMPVVPSPLAGGIIQFAGSARVSMKDFKISPPAPSFAAGVIKTGDEVKLTFVWCVKPLGTLEARR